MWLFTLALALAPAGAAADSASAPVQFRPAELTVKWADLKLAKQAGELLNDTGSRMEIGLAVSSIKNGEGVALCRGCVRARLVVPGEGATRPLRPGQGAPLELSATGTAAPSDGRYQGTVIAFVNGGAGVRVPLTVVVGTAGSIDPEPAVETTEATVHCYVPFGHFCRGDAEVEIPLKEGVEVKDPAALALPTGEVGALSGDAGSARVRYGGEVKEEGGGGTIELVLDHISGVGDYEGKVDLLPADDKAGDVTIKAAVSDAWGWAAGMLALGILAGLLLLRLAGSGRAIFNLRLRLGETLTDLDDAQGEFDRAAKDTDWAGFTVASAAASEGTELKTKIDALGFASFSQLDAEKVKKIEERLAKLATAATELRALATDFPALKTATDALAKREPGLDGEPPPLRADALALFGGERVLDLAELSQRVKDVQTKTALATSWKKYERLISDYIYELGQIDALDDKNDACARSLEALAGRLWEVRDETQFASEDIEGALAEVHKSIHDLQVGRKLKASEFVRTLTGVTSWNLVEGGLLERIYPEVPAAPAPVTQPLPAPLSSSAAELEKLKEFGFRREAALAIVAFLIAVVTGMSTLYMDKAWGDWIDYANAFLWGIVTKTALDLLLAPSLDQLAKVRPFGPLFRRA
ncbi:MAG: hypothetical protein H0V84_09965 [Actinobacteria bacterium]|nr:hypothetical protein [Actinomycetota bacterium]